MEHLYSLVIIFSGATIVLLGTFLFTSERELRNKRRELDQFKREHGPAPSAMTTEDQPSEAPSSAQLIARNDELVLEISLLSSRLEESQRTLDEQRRLMARQSDSQHGQRTIDNLRQQLETSDAQVRESASQVQEAVDFSAKLQTEIASLKQQAADREEVIATLQSAAQQAADTQSQLCNENQRLQEEIDKLRNQLRNAENRLDEIAGQNKEIFEQCAQLQTSFARSKQETEQLMAKNNELLDEVDMLSGRLAAGEKCVEDLRAIQHHAQLDNQQLLETNQQLQKEITAFQEQLETAQSQLVQSAERNREAAERNEQVQADIEALGRQLETRDVIVHELQHESQKLLLEKQDLQEELESHRIQLKERARLIDGKGQLQPQLAESAEPLRRAHDADIIQTAANTITESSSATDPVLATRLAKLEKPSRAVWPSSKRQWSFGAVAAIVIIVIAGAVGRGFFETRVWTSRETAVARETSSDEYPAEALATLETKQPVAKPQIKPVPQVRGTFQTIRPTRVYSGPSENSAPITDVGKGTKLNVVDSTDDGWLEVRSKHGRPPGFIRQETAIRIGQN